MAIMDEIATIKSFFQSHQVPLSTAWLEGCVNWCREENPANSIKELQLKVYEQWLLLDLRDVEVPSLPPDLASKTKFILHGNYSLQMMKVVDISKPKYWQLQRIRNSTAKNIDADVESSKRVLQMTLTDGVQEVEAMEYKPISCLSLNLSPGVKIRLTGPITVRRGRLMLEEKNVKILGGEVEDLIVSNAAENILATALKQPLNPKPNVIEESLVSANTDMFNATGTTRTSNRNQSNVGTSTSARSVPSTNTRQNQATRVPNTANIPVPPRRNDVQTMDVDEIEEMRIAAEVAMLMEVERDFEEPPAKKKKENSRTPDMFDDEELDAVLENIEIPSAVIETIPKASTSNVHDSLEFGNDVFENIDIDAHLDQATHESNWKPCTPKTPSVLSIAKLSRNIPNITNGKFKIKARFKEVVEKLTVLEDEYRLVVRVEDDTGDLVVKFHTDIICSFSGHSATALNNLKMAVLENNDEARAILIQAMRRIKDKLNKLNHVLEIQISVKEEYPVIVNISE